MNRTETIGVIGAGTMGTGIVQSCASAGLPVVMLHVDEQRVACDLATVAAGLEQLCAKGKRSPEEHGAAPNASVGPRTVASTRTTPRNAPARGAAHPPTTTPR